MESHPVMIYATLIIGVLLVVSQAVPKILGPVGAAASDWSRRRREQRIAQEDADMADLQRQVTYLTQKRAEDRAEHAREQVELKDEFAEHRRMWAEREDRWRREWHHHRQWDYQALEALTGRKPPFDPSPPFMTPDPPSIDRTHP